MTITTHTFNGQTVTVDLKHVEADTPDLRALTLNQLCQLENAGRSFLGEGPRKIAQNKTLGVARCWGVLERVAEAQDAPAQPEPESEPEVEVLTVDADMTEAEVVEAAKKGRLVHANLPTDQGLPYVPNFRQSDNIKKVREQLAERFGGTTEVTGLVGGHGGRVLAEFTTYYGGGQDRRVMNFGRRGGVQLLLRQRKAFITLADYGHKVHTVDKAVSTDAKGEVA